MDRRTNTHFGSRQPPGHIAREESNISELTQALAYGTTTGRNIASRQGIARPIPGQVSSPSQYCITRQALTLRQNAVPTQYANGSENPRRNTSSAHSATTSFSRSRGQLPGSSLYRSGRTDAQVNQDDLINRLHHDTEYQRQQQIQQSRPPTTSSNVTTSDSESEDDEDSESSGHSNYDEKHEPANPRSNHAGRQTRPSPHPRTIPPGQPPDSPPSPPPSRTDAPHRKSLNQGAFRLLKIIPGPDRYNHYHCPRPGCNERLCDRLHCTRLPCDKLHCNLFEYHSFASAPAYETLSYTWGDPKFKSTVHIANLRIEIEVTTNCTNALRALRRPTKPTTIWVDSICINQRDAEEKAQQIGIMGQLYHHARLCVAYVGEEDNFSKKVFIDCKYLHRRNHSNQWSSQDLAQRQGVLASFMARAWFHRLWVIQEALLSKVIRLQCGRNSVDWTEFSALYREVYGLPTDVIISEAFDRSIPELRNAYIHQAQRRGPQHEASFPGGSERQTKRSTPSDALSGIGCLEYSKLFDVMHATQKYQCRDPRDKVFALLSLFSGTVPEALRPDYSSNVRSIYARTSLYLLVSIKDLRVLQSARTVNSKDSMPTWAVDWRKLDERPKPMNLGSNQYATDEPKQNINVCYAFGSGLSRVLTISLNSRIVDKVVQLGPVCRHKVAGADASKAVELRSLWLQFQKGAYGHHKRHGERKTLTTKRTGENTLSLLPGELTAAVRETFAWLCNSDVTSSGCTMLVEKSLWVLFGRRLFVTKTGCVGLGPAHMREGDALCLFASANALFTVRQQSTNRPRNPNDSSTESDNSSTESDESSTESEDSVYKLVGECLLSWSQGNGPEYSDMERVSLI